MSDPEDSGNKRKSDLIDKDQPTRTKSLQETSLNANLAKQKRASMESKESPF